MEMSIPVLTPFLKELNTALTREGIKLLQYEKSFRILESEFKLMEGFLRDFDRRMREEESFRIFVISMQSVLYEAENTLFDCETRAAKWKDFWKIRSRKGKDFWNLKFRYRTSKTLKRLIQNVAYLKSSISSYIAVLPPIAIETVLRESFPILNVANVVGFKTDLMEIKGWLNTPHLDIEVIGLVGLGGLGKTTIAKMIFNDKDIDSLFSKKIWLYARERNAKDIFESMFRSVGLDDNLDGWGISLQKLKMFLLNERCLIVLDDLLKEGTSWLDDVLEVLPERNGTRIIFTSRNREAARNLNNVRIHHPKCLDEEDSWSLFSKLVFGIRPARVNKELEGLGKKIVAKCGGLPLAIKWIAKMLQEEPSLPGWNNTLLHFSENFQQAANVKAVKAALMMSYNELSAELKSCLLSFSFFPPASRVSREQLTYWWIGENFVPLDSDSSPLEGAEKCLTVLLDCCLLESVDTNFNGTIKTFKVHCLVYNLLTKLAHTWGFTGDHRLCVGGTEQHASLGYDLDCKKIKDKTKLRAVISVFNADEVHDVDSEDAQLICKCRCLKMLDLSRSIFSEPVGTSLRKIGNLKHLKYLNLGSTLLLTELPPSMAKLENLQILILSQCRHLQNLPSFVWTFKNLLVLDLRHCNSLRQLPKGVGKVSKLEELWGFRPSREEGGCEFSELASLSKLKKLELYLSSGNDLEWSEATTLLSLEKLEFLSIHCVGQPDDVLVEKIEILKIPSTLNELCLQCYPSKITPSWLCPTSLHMLQYLSIVGGKIEKMNTSFWKECNLWNIKGMRLELLLNLDEQEKRFHDSIHTLQTMEIIWCPSMERYV